MELALSLGDTSKPFTTFLDKPKKMVSSRDLGFCMGLGKSFTAEEVSDHHHSKSRRDEGDSERRGSSDPPVHELDLLPFSPVPRSQTSSSQLSFSWLTQHLSVAVEPGSSNGIKRSIGVEKKASEEGTSSPNSAASSFQMDFSIYRNGFSRSSNKLSELEENDEGEMMDRGVSSKVASDEDDQNIGSMARKKLRLTKQQSAFLEESFKEHNTLNPKQKLALAKQLNLRPRQVEVWFQNRRARTKLKQTEIDCEYLKRCCETLTEENRRLQKELQDLRALKSSQPFYMQLPPTTLTMCPSCERIANNNTSTASENVANTTLSLAKPRQTPPTLMVPFSPSQQVQAPQAAAASS